MHSIFKNPFFKIWAVAGACALCPLMPVLAQTASAEVVITGNPLGREQTAVPASVLGRGELLERGQTTLGETLNGLPGISSTYFGPNASRPVIRGLDGDRIRVLNNSGASADVSALSYDHAVPLDVLSTERIEVLRGPAALQFGGSAVGGVVNVIDNRIPREPLPGLSGKAQLQAGTGNDERSAAGLLESGNARWAWHVDGFDRRTGDVRVPVVLTCDKGGDTRYAARICNSASQSRGGAIGASTFWDGGFLGASVNTHQSDYGTVAEDQVTIGMKTTRYALEAEQRQLPGIWHSVSVRLSHTDYRHTEFDSGVPGTVFAKQGQDLRLQARHRDASGWQGLVGVQFESNRFSAEGDEAFAPASHTRSQAVFVHELLPTAWGQFNAGARAESVLVTSLGSPVLDRFEVGSRQFAPWSLAMGAAVKLTGSWQLTGNAAMTERAPTDYELFANGPHLATHAWEVGSSHLRPEKSRSLDAGLAWKSGPERVGLTLFASDFGNYIGLLGTGQSQNGLPVQTYQGVEARFRGLEASGRQRLWQGTAKLDLDWRADSVRANNLRTGEPLPRIAPLRLGVTVLFAQGPWNARWGTDWHAAQNRVPAGGVATAAYTLVNASVSYRQQLGSVWLDWFARLDNLGNQLAYSATSILTATAFGKSPLPGRSLRLGVQAGF